MFNTVKNKVVISASKHFHKYSIYKEEICVVMRKGKVMIQRIFPVGYALYFSFRLVLNVNYL